MGLALLFAKSAPVSSELAALKPPCRGPQQLEQQPRTGGQTVAGQIVHPGSSKEHCLRTSSPGTEIAPGKCCIALAPRKPPAPVIIILDCFILIVSFLVLPVLLSLSSFS